MTRTAKSRTPRADARERQAVAAAEAARAGRAHAGFSPTEPAPRPIGLGAGRPLPGPLRGRAEAAFRADLSAVRLHAPLSAMPGVAAFAAGPDIVLGPGRAPADTLILHEIAHVLQQNAERLSDGRLRVARRYGSGVPYAAGGPLDGDNKPERDNLIEKLITVHRTGDGGATDADLEDVITLIGRTSYDEEGVDGKALSDEILAGIFSGSTKRLHELSRRARGLIFNVLKFGGWNRAAAVLLSGDIDLPTAARHKPLLQYFNDTPAVTDAILLKVFGKGRRLRQFVTSALTESIRNYLLDLPRLRQPLYGWDEYYTALWTEVNDWDVLGRNDAISYGAAMIAYISDDYDAFIKAAEKVSGNRATAPLLFKANMAQQIAAWAGDYAGYYAGSTSMGFVADAFWDIETMAGRAYELWFGAWKRVQDLLLAASGAMDATEPLGESAPVKQVRTELRKAAMQLLSVGEAGGKPVLPPASVNRANRKAFEGKVADLLTMLDSFLRKNALRDAEFTEAEKDAATLRVLLMELPRGLHHHDALTKDAKGDELDDIRFANRLYMARLLGQMSRILRDGILEAHVTKVLRGEDIRATTLALLAPWEAQPGIPVNDLKTDFGSTKLPISMAAVDLEGKPYRLAIPLTIATLINAYRLFYSRRLANFLDYVLHNDTPQVDTAKETVLSQAYRKARGTIDRPTRWSVPSVEIALYAKETRPWREIVATHPRTQRELMPQAQALGTVILPDQEGAVFAWVIPSLQPLIQLLRKVDALNAVVEETVADPAALSDAEWLENLTYATENAATLEQVLKDITGHLDSRQKVEDARLETLVPQAVSYERRLLEPKVRKLLTAYSDDHLKNYGAPTDAAALIEDFLRFVTPQELKGRTGGTVPHAPAQLAALLLMMSGKLVETFAPENISGLDSFGRRVESRFDIITAFTPMLRTALDASKSASYDGVKQIMSPAEISALDVARARADLKLLLRRFEEIAVEMSTKLSLLSTGKVLRSNLYASEIVPSPDPFMHNGRKVTIVAILYPQPFVFLPAYGRGDKQVHPPILLDAKREPIEPSGRALVRIKFGDGPPFNITDELSGANLEMLEELNGIVTDRALQLSMEATLEVIEAAGELALDAAEFVPGAGQALMVARIVHSVYQFFATDEFDDMLAVLRGDPVRMLEELQSRLSTDLFDSNKIWEFLLFDSSGIDYLDKEPKKDERRERLKRRDKTKKFARLIEAIARIPKSVYKAVDEVRERTVPAAQNVQFYVASHPRVAHGMEVAATLLAGAPVLQDISDLGDAFSGADDPQAALDKKLSSLLATVDNFNLPDDPIPNEIIVERMLEFTLERLRNAGKLGTAIKILLPILRATGALAEISERLAAALAGTAVDPNVYWRENVRPQLIDAFTAAKTDFVDVANRELTQFGFAGLPQPGKVVTTGRAFEGIGPEASPKLNPALRPDGTVRPPAIGPGRRLPHGLAARAARDFGHDMGHVRLHTGPDAARLTARYGADGLSAGSHVFLRPGLSPAYGPGAGVFGHELAHVLQVGGPRPLGRGRHPDTALPVRHGGIRYHPGREAAADRAARVAGGPGHRIGRPVEAGVASGPAATGLAPAFGGKDLARILQLFTEPADIEDYLSDIAKTAKLIASAPGDTIAQGIWADAKAALSSSGKATWAGPLKSPAAVQALVTDQLTTGAGKAIDKRILVALALRAQKNKSGPPGPGGVTTELDPKAFANVLETYIFALTGVATSITLDSSGSAPGVKRIRVYLVDLGRIGELAHPLWVKAFANSPRTSGYGGQDKEILFRIARLRRPDEQILQSSEFRLHDKFLDRFETLKTDTKGVSVVAWTDYTTVTPGGPGAHKDHRLYLGKHGDLAGRVTDRESHHIPQFVLVEYFRNEAETKMFSKAEERLPGFQATNNPGKYDDGTNTIDLDALRPSSARGDGMPAILLAARTHKMGKLHVGGNDSWTNQSDYGKPPKTQSEQVDTRFKKSAVRRLKAAGAPATATDKAIGPAADWANLPINKAKAGPAVFEAMRETYHWMYKDVMRPALKRALRTEEPKFFIASALQARGGTATTLPDTYNPQKALNRADAVIAQVDAMQHHAAYEIRNFHPNV